MRTSRYRSWIAGSNRSGGGSGGIVAASIELFGHQRLQQGLLIVVLVVGVEQRAVMEILHRRARLHGQRAAKDQVAQEGLHDSARPSTSVRYGRDELRLVLRRRISDLKLYEGGLERLLETDGGRAPIVPPTRPTSGEERGDAIVAGIRERGLRKITKPLAAQPRQSFIDREVLAVLQRIHITARSL